MNVFSKEMPVWERSCNPATVLVLQELCHFLTQGLWYFILLQIASQQAKFRVPRVKSVAQKFTWIKTSLKIATCTQELLWNNSWNLTQPNSKCGPRCSSSFILLSPAIKLLTVLIRVADVIKDRNAIKMQKAISLIYRRRQSGVPEYPHLGLSEVMTTCHGILEVETCLNVGSHFWSNLPLSFFMITSIWEKKQAGVGRPTIGCRPLPSQCHSASAFCVSKTLYHYSHLSSFKSSRPSVQGIHWLSTARANSQLCEGPVHTSQVPQMCVCVCLLLQ